MENKVTPYLLYLLYHTRILFQSLRSKSDPERIHELRVTLRKIRSLNKLFVDKPLPYLHFLKTTMESTNTLRDLDVLLGSLSRSRTPSIVKALTKQRKNRFSALFTPTYIDKNLLIIDEYSQVLMEENSVLLSDMVIQKVLTHYEHCLESYLALPKDADPKTLHRLRIRFKDARYGFEFLEISGIHYAKEVMEHCKEFQTLLGAIQDKVNQINLLKELYKEAPTLELDDLIKKEKKKLRRLKETTQSELSHNAEGSRSFD
jgi:CHAD domain-containing protein